MSEKTYGVSINALELATVQEYMTGKFTDKFLTISELAKENDCKLVVCEKNNLIFIFLLNKQRNMFYNKASELVKCEKLNTTPVKVERNMPIIRA